MSMEAAGYTCPQCGWDRQFVQQLVKDENGHIDHTVLVCKSCGCWFEVTP